MSWFQNVVRQFEPVMRHVSDLVSTRVSAHFGFPPESATAATELLMRAHAGDDQAREKISRLARNPKMRGYLLEVSRHLREHPNYGAFRAHAEQRPVEPPPPPVQEVAPPPPPDERRSHHHHHHHGEHPWPMPQGPVPPPYDPRYGWAHAHGPAYCDAWGCHGHEHGQGPEGRPEAWRRHPHDGWHGHDAAAAQLYGEPPPWAFGTHPHAPFFGGVGPMHRYGWHEPARYGLPMPPPGTPHPWGYAHTPLALPPSYPHYFAPTPHPYAPFYSQRDVPYGHGWLPPHPGAFGAPPPPPMRGPAPPVPASPVPPAAQEHMAPSRAAGLTTHSTWSAGTPEVGRAQVVGGEEATGADRPYVGHVPHPHFHHRPGFGAEPFGTEWLLEEQQALERLVTPDDGEPEAWRGARAPGGTPGI